MESTKTKQNQLAVTTIGMKLTANQITALAFATNQN
jgi:hypothetical protein